MKTNIITYEIDENKLRNKIDENKLRNKIIDFECITNQHAYIFMNQKTASVFEEQHKPYIIGSKEAIEEHAYKFKNGFYIEAYGGNKIFIDDDLEFGEIDIR